MKIEPIVERYGTPLQLSRFNHSLSLVMTRRERYVPSQTTLAYARAAYDAALASDNRVEVSVMQSNLGGCYFFRNELAEAKEHLGAALELARTTGDRVLRVRCLAYLTSVRSSDQGG